MPRSVPAQVLQAMAMFRQTVRRCMERGMSQEDALAAMAMELMPRLAAVYGAAATADLLHSLADSVLQPHTESGTSLQ